MPNRSRQAASVVCDIAWHGASGAAAMSAAAPVAPHAAGVLAGASLDARPREELERMLAAAEEVRECHRVLDRANLNIVGECLKHQGTFYELDHYPEGDVYDDRSHSQYYYHAHRGLAGEHGHFHTFVRAKGMPEGVEPVPYEGAEPWPQGDDVLSHLVAVSMDRYGFPIGFFTTNRWVTGENWFRAPDVIRLLDAFVIDHAYPSWPVNRWLSAMLVLFRPTLERLLVERDAALHAWQQRHPDRDVFEDRELEVLSEARVDVAEQVAGIERALTHARSRT